VSRILALQPFEALFECTTLGLWRFREEECTSWHSGFSAARRQLNSTASYSNITGIFVVVDFEPRFSE